MRGKRGAERGEMLGRNWDGKRGGQEVETKGKQRGQERERRGKEGKKSGE